MNGIFTVLLSACLLSQAAYASLSEISSPGQNKASETDKELSCELSLPREVHAINGYIDASLVIRNTSDHSVKICTLTQGWRSVGKTDYTEILRPDVWKSDRPPPSEFPKHIVTIEAGKSISIPLKIRYYEDILRGQPLTISVGYETESAFAKQYGTWVGSIRSQPVTVDVIER